jgi:tRNA threonylcarbamoyladenosine modification (KEOPS) complex Cgi121 subunit
LPRSTRCYRIDGKVASEDLSRSIRGEFPGLLVQTVDSAAATNEMFVEMIGEQTLEAGAAGSPLAKKPEVDLLMRLGGTTQIARAILQVGVKRGYEFILVVVGNEADILKLESTRSKGWERMPRHQLDRDDLQRIERAALLDAERA